MTFGSRSISGYWQVIRRSGVPFVLLAVGLVVGCSGSAISPAGDFDAADADGTSPAVENTQTHIHGDFLRCPTAQPDCTQGTVTTPSVSAAETVVPGPGLPPEVTTQRSNNNLDIVVHNGRLFLAFRTAKWHFADAAVEMYVVSTTDQVTWRFEGKFKENRDVREPRLLSWNGRLWLFYAVLGDDFAGFEPHAMKRAEYRGPGDWSAAEEFYGQGSGFIPWRAKVVDGKPYLICYVGGENIYSLGGDGDAPEGDSTEAGADAEGADGAEDADGAGSGAHDRIFIHWLTTRDGDTWEPVIPGRAVVQAGGGSETDFVVRRDGSLVVVVRNEAGDDYGWGSKICTAPAGDWGQWTCKGDPLKYDSPLLFPHNDEVYLIGRRNLDEAGRSKPYDLGRSDLPFDQQSLQNQLDYWKRPKRCALWRIDPATRSATWVLDLPSQGDTCFAAVVRVGPSEYLVYNYTTDLAIEGDPGWRKAQFDLESHIVWQLIRLPSSPRP